MIKDIISIPYEEGAYWRKGMKFGPEAILRKFMDLREYSIENDSCVDMSDLNIKAPLKLSPYNKEKALSDICGFVTKTLAEKHVPIILGGDHSVTYPVIEAFSNKYGKSNFGILHFDAHSDTFGDVEGYRYHHGAMFRNIVEEGLIDEENIIQFGMRGQVRSDSLKYLYSPKRTTVTMSQLHDSEYDITKYIERDDLPYYISFDIDFMDPAFAPGTGTPVPGGCSSINLMKIVSKLKKYSFVGLDIVEVAPVYDSSDITSLLAANLIHLFLSGLNFISRG